MVRDQQTAASQRQVADRTPCPFLSPAPDQTQPDLNLPPKEDSSSCPQRKLLLLKESPCLKPHHDRAIVCSKLLTSTKQPLQGSQGPALHPLACLIYRLSHFLVFDHADVSVNDVFLLLIICVYVVMGVCVCVHVEPENNLCNHLQKCYLPPLGRFSHWPRGH